MVAKAWSGHCVEEPQPVGETSEGQRKRRGARLAPIRAAERGGDFGDGGDDCKPKRECRWGLYKKTTRDKESRAQRTALEDEE